MHRETLGSAECCLKGLKSVIMCTSQRRLPPQLRVENEKAEEEVRTGREGGKEDGFQIFLFLLFEVFHCVQPERVPSPSAEEEEEEEETGVSPSAAEPGKHKGPL